MEKCNICGKEFDSKRKVNSHSQVHKDNHKLSIEKMIKTQSLEKVLIAKTCKNCNKEFSIYRKIKKDGSFSSKKDDKIFCSRACSNKRIHSIETKAKISKNTSGIKSSGYKDGRSHIRINCKTCNKLIKQNTYGYCMDCLRKTSIYKEILSNSLKGKTGGYRKCSNRHRGGYYKNKWFDSLFEIEVAKFLDEKNFNWVRNTKRFYFIWKNKKAYYIPDFYFPDKNLYLETKGYYFSDRKERTYAAVKSNDINWVEFMQSEWIKNKNYLLELL